MESVVNVLSSPEAWINGVFFGLVVWIIQLAVPRIPSGVRNVLRLRRLKLMKRIKLERRNPFLVIQAVGKANAYFVVFALLCVAYFYGLIILTPKPVSAFYKSAAMVLGMPIYMFEVAWLIKRDYADDLVKARTRLYKNASAQNPFGRN